MWENFSQMPFKSTTIFKPLAALFVAVLGLSAKAQTAEVFGTAPLYAGAEISLTVYADPISERIAHSATAVIDSSGSFRLAAAIEDTCSAVIKIRRFSAPIYLEPGAEYRVEISEENEFVLINTWQKGELRYTLYRENPGELPDINEAASETDRLYYKFFAENAALIGTRQMRRNLEAFREELTGRYPPGSFAGRYAEYTYAEMKLAAGLPRKEVYDAVFAEGPLPYSHPGRYGVFTLFYEGVLDAYSSRFGGAEMYNRMQSGLSLYEVDSLLMRDDFLVREDLRRAVLLLNLKNAYYDRRYPAGAVLRLIDEIAEAERRVRPETAAIAEGLPDKLTRTGKGSPVTELAGMADAGDPRPFFIMISAPWSTVAEREAISLATLAEKYGDHFRIAEISVSPLSGRTDLPKRPWPVMRPTDAETVMKQLEVYRIPHFSWADEEGLLTDTQAPYPSTGLEKVLYRMKIEAEKASEIKVGR